MGGGSSKTGANHQEVTDATLLLIGQLKSVPVADRKDLLEQLALLMGGDANGDGVIDAGESRSVVAVYGHTIPLPPLCR